MYKYKLFLLIAGCCLLISCASKNNMELSIKFSEDHSTILISNIEPIALLQLKNKINTDTTYQKLVSVLETPSDDDSLSMEKEWPGRLSMKGDLLVFTPDSPFLAKKTYLLETVLNTQFAQIEDITRSEVGHQIKKQQKILRLE